MLATTAPTADAAPQLRTPPPLTYFESVEDAQDAAARLKALGSAARKLLSTCIEHQSATRRTQSATATALEAEGFLFIRFTGSVFYEEYLFTPTLAGEDALDWLEYLATT